MRKFSLLIILLIVSFAIYFYVNFSSQYSGDDEYSFSTHYYGNFHNSDKNPIDVDMKFVVKNHQILVDRVRKDLDKKYAADFEALMDLAKNKT